MDTRFADRELAAWGLAQRGGGVTTTKSGRLHANTKCERCGCRNTDPLNLVKVHPDTGAKRCQTCHFDVTVYGKAAAL